MYLRNYRLSKSCLEHFQKTAISEILLRLNMLKDPKHLWNLDEGTFIIFFFFFFITLRRNYLENISLIEIWNLTVIC